MKNRISFLAGSAVLSVVLAGSASADAVAGWDFSQYFSDSVLSTDGSTYGSTLDANYSSLDPTFNAGSEAAAFGTAYFDGSFGSSSIAAGSGTEALVPTAGSLASNIDGSADGIGTNSFDAHTVLEAEGQVFGELLAMTARSTVSMVFEVDLTSASDSAREWEIHFGGKTATGTSNVGVEFSTDGSNYASFGSVGLTTTDTGYEVVLQNVVSPTAYVRLNLDASAGQPIIDNVAVVATPLPEPGVPLGFAASAVTLWALQRRRSS